MFSHKYEEIKHLKHHFSSNCQSLYFSYLDTGESKSIMAFFSDPPPVTEISEHPKFYVAFQDYIWFHILEA